MRMRNTSMLRASGLAVAGAALVLGTAARSWASLTEYYDFENDTAASGGIHDQSGFNRDGSPGASSGSSQAVAFSSDVPTQLTGRSQKSLDLTSPVDDFVVSDTPGYTGVLGKNPRTVSVWEKISSNAATDRQNALITWGSNSNGSFGNRWAFRIDGKKNNVLRVEDRGGFIYGTTSVADGTWHNLAAVLPDTANPDITDVKLYVDGTAEMIANSSSQAVDTADHSNVGVGGPVASRRDDTGIVYQGLLDDAAVYDQALSSQQVGRLAAGTSPQTVVPEPASLALLGLGGLAMLGRRRRRGRARG